MASVVRGFVLYGGVGMEKKYGGIVSDWQIHNLTAPQEAIEEVYPDMGAKPMVFTGTVVDSPKFKDGWHMRSSLIVDIDRERGIIETLNTRYKIDTSSEGNDTFKDLGDVALNIFY